VVQEMIAQAVEKKTAELTREKESAAQAAVQAERKTWEAEVARLKAIPAPAPVVLAPPPAPVPVSAVKKRAAPTSKHDGVSCKDCKVKSIEGYRYISLKNPAESYCDECESKSVRNFPVLRVNKSEDAPESLLLVTMGGTNFSYSASLTTDSKFMAPSPYSLTSGPPSFVPLNSARPMESPRFVNSPPLPYAPMGTDSMVPPPRPIMSMPASSGLSSYPMARKGLVGTMAGTMDPYSSVDMASMTGKKSLSSSLPVAPPTTYGISMPVEGYPSCPSSPYHIIAPPTGLNRAGIPVSAPTSMPTYSNPFDAFSEFGTIDWICRVCNEANRGNAPKCQLCNTTYAVQFEKRLEDEEGALSAYVDSDSADEFDPFRHEHVPRL
jgi:hypothetical protein